MNNGLLDLFIVILAGVIHAMLQLGISALLILYHASLGKDIKKKTKELTLNFILGFSLFTGLAVSSICFFILVIFGGVMPAAGVVILVMALAVMAFFVWFVYYRRKSKGTELWIPRSFARFVSARAKKTDDNVESFSLGMLIACAEVPFAAMLMITAGNSIVNMPQGLQIISVLVYVIFAAAPMWLCQVAIHYGDTVVDIQKWRVRNKEFFKVMSGVGFITLAIFMLAFKVFGSL
ncbi:hypothetical protein IJJ18_01655 [Candidatus Saccharibacteria bacterium]|nr:hypothetical protein [Candidatus Saccharibacteria bacterium]